MLSSLKPLGILKYLGLNGQDSTEGWGSGVGTLTASQPGSSRVLESSRKEQTKGKGLGGWEALLGPCLRENEAQGNYLMPVFTNHNGLLL